LKKSKPILLFLLFLVIVGLNLIPDEPAVAPLAAEEMRVHFLDVGQGDSILIELPNGQSMLVDGGTRRAGGFVKDYIKSLGINHLDYVVATHPHEDHIGGLVEVIGTIPVGSVYMPRVVHTSQTFETFIQTVAAARSALNSLGAVILESHIQGCVKDAIQSDKSEKIINELAEVIKKYMK
jgi:competence protein ComEC